MTTPPMLRQIRHDVWATEHLIERMTWPQVDERIKQGVDAVLIPIGSTEQHGPHMPLDTDCLIARELCRLAAEAGEEEGVRLLVAPTLNVTRSSRIRTGCAPSISAYQRAVSCRSSQGTATCAM